MAFGILGHMRQSHESAAKDSATTVDEELCESPRLSTGPMFGGDELAEDMMHHEKSMSLGYLFKHYRHAMSWAALMATPFVFQGYATTLLPDLFSYAPFLEKYGHQIPGQTEYAISTPWQAGITMASACGQLAGLCVAPYVLRPLGYLTSSDTSLVLALLSTVIGMFSLGAGNPLAVFLVGQLCVAVPMGLLQGIILPYIADVTPLRLRASASAVINIFWLTGQFVSAAVLRGARQVENSNWSIQYPLFINFAWLLLIRQIVCRAPESPVSLVQRGHDDEAMRVLERLHRHTDFAPDTALSVLRAVDTHEQKTSSETGLLSCFRGVHLRRTEIAIMVSVTQQCVGMPLISYPLQLLHRDGLSSPLAVPITFGLLALFMLSTLFSMPAMGFVGRRTLWLAGLVVELISLVALGSLDFYEVHGSKNVSVIMAYVTVFLAMVYHFTTGPVCYAIIAETPASRLKVETNALARVAYILLSMVNVFLVPQLLAPEPLGWNIGSRAAFVWAGTAGGCLIWAWFRLPEMKDRSPAEIDILFEQKVPARQWHAATF
ncbi:hypothetical protein E4U53_008173 [Claviceps sorghi]|nr:hypothetical protein E4U53_008173 [Claviceps sorghi]